APRLGRPAGGGGGGGGAAPPPPVSAPSSSGRTMSARSSVSKAERGLLNPVMTATRFAPGRVRSPASSPSAGDDRIGKDADKRMVGPLGKPGGLFIFFLRRA